MQTKVAENCNNSIKLYQEAIKNNKGAIGGD